ncbi:hypothetical protein ACJMK2_018477 [Sinanodonta woodiana]|uniref:SEA domain-containing protein n=1 Tax=Sinanodonta woodiana TaxID=1069815 RepID=A0ABD3UDK7_SINWO
MWPHLSTLYTSTHNLDEAGKNPDPLMGIDNVFDPNEPYGAYRYCVQPRSEMSIEEPSYTRGIYKDDESRSRSSDYVIGGGFKRGSACKIILCIFLVMSFIGVVLAAITLAVILSQHNVTRRWPSPIEFDSEMTLTGANFTPKLRDNTSEEFKAMEKSFCSALHELFLADDSPIQSEWSGCEVLEFSNGSVVARFRIFVRPRDKVVTEGMDSMEEQLKTYLSKKLRDDGPWKALKINLDSIKNFVKIDNTGWMKVTPSITTPTSGTTTTTTSTTTKEIINTSPNVLITSVGMVNTHSITRSTTTDASMQEMVLTQRPLDVSMKSVTTVGVKTEVLGVSSTSTTETVTGEFVDKFSTSAAERQTAQSSHFLSTAGRTTSAAFGKNLPKVISTGTVLDMTDVTTKRSTTFTTEKMSTELDITVSTTPNPIPSIVSTDARKFVSTWTTPILKADSAEQSTTKTLSEGTSKLVMANMESTITSLGEAVTTEGAMAIANISMQQDTTTSNLLSTSSNSFENATEITYTLDLINISTPVALVSNAEPIGISTTAFTDVVSRPSTDLGLISVKENMTTSSTEKSLNVEDITLPLKTNLSTALPTSVVALTKYSTLDTSAPSAMFLTTSSPEVSSIIDFEPTISTITDIVTTIQSNGMTDSTIVPVNTSTISVSSELPSVIDGRTVSPDVEVSTYTSLNFSEAINLTTFTDVNATYSEIEFTTLASNVFTEATNTSTDLPSVPAEVSTSTAHFDNLSNVSDLIRTNASLELSTGQITNFIETTISSNITSTTEFDITSPSVANSTNETQAENSKMIVSTEPVQVSSVAEVIVTKSTQVKENLSQQPDNVTLGMDPTTIHINEMSYKPEINVTLAELSSTETVLEDSTTTETVSSSTHFLDITPTQSAETDSVKIEITTSDIAITMKLSPAISTMHTITTSEFTQKTNVSEVDRPTITSTAEYNYTSFGGNVSSDQIYNETTDSSLSGKEIGSNISAETTDQNVTITQVQLSTNRMATSTVTHSSRQTTQSTTTFTIDSVFGTPHTSTNQDRNVTVPQLQITTEEIATLSVSHSARQTTYNTTIGTNNSTIGTSQSISLRTSTDQGLVDGVSSTIENLSNVSSGTIYNETTDSPLNETVFVSNISSTSSDETITVPQVQSMTERMATSTVSLSEGKTTQLMTETISSVFGTSRSNLPLTSTDQILIDGISSDNETFKVSSGPVYTETREIESIISTTDSSLVRKDIVSNILAETTDQNVTIPQIQTTTTSMATTTISHPSRQTTQITTTETIKSVLSTSQSSTDQGLVDGISSADANFTVSSGTTYETTYYPNINQTFNTWSGPNNNETTDSPFVGKEIVLNISAEIADRNETVPQLQTTTMVTGSSSHSDRQTSDINATDTNNSTMGTPQSNSSQTSTDQSFVDGNSSTSIIEETSQSGLTEFGSQQPSTVASVNELNAMVITTVEIINFTTESQPLVSENVSDGHPISNNSNNNALNTSIDIFNNEDVTLPISGNTTLPNTGATNAHATGVTTKNPNNTETSNVTILSAASDSVDVSTLASESIITNTLSEMTTVATNTIDRGNQTETVPANVMPTIVNVTETITDTNLTGNLANTTDNYLYNETVNGNVTESIITHTLWEMTTAAANTIDRGNQTETVPANVTPTFVNVTETITDTNLTGNLANTTENSLYNETVNGNVAETTPYILTSSSKYLKETESSTQRVELRNNGTSPASWNTSDNLENTNGVTFDTVSLNGTINSTDASNVIFPVVSPVENSTISTSANESAGNDTLVYTTNTGSSDVRTESILSVSDVTSTPKSNITESEPLI